MNAAEWWQQFVEKHGDTFGVLLWALFGALTRFIKLYVWPDPRAIYFMFIMYLLNYLADLQVLYQAKTLHWRIALSKFLNVLKNALGALVLLYVATASGKYSLVFIWFPTAMFGILLVTLITLVLKHASRLGIITPEFEKYLAGRTSITIKGDESTTQPPVVDPNQSLEQPESKVS